MQCLHDEVHTPFPCLLILFHECQLMYSTHLHLSISGRLNILTVQPTTDLPTYVQQQHQELPFFSSASTVGVLPEGAMWHLAHNIAQALESMQEMGVSAVNVSPRNIRWDESGSFLLSNWFLSHLSDCGQDVAARIGYVSFPSV